jgi:hypothetical protein
MKFGLLLTSIKQTVYVRFGLVEIREPRVAVPFSSTNHLVRFEINLSQLLA